MGILRKTAVFHICLMKITEKKITTKRDIQKTMVSGSRDSE